MKQSYVVVLKANGHVSVKRVYAESEDEAIEMVKKDHGVGVEVVRVTDSASSYSDYCNTLDAG